MELRGGERFRARRPVAVQGGEEHGAGRDVQTRGQRGCRADHPDEPGLEQVFHAHPPRRQVTGVVGRDPAAPERGQHRVLGEPGDLRDPLLEALGPARFIRRRLASQQARRLVALAPAGEEQDGRREAALLERIRRGAQPPSVARARGHGVGIGRQQPPNAVGEQELQGDRPRLERDHLRCVTAHFAEPRRELVRIGDRGRQHQQAGLPRGEEEDLLPGRAALGIGEVMRLVEDDDVGGRGGARGIVEGVAEDLRGRDEHRGAGVDAALSREQPDGIRAVQSLEPPELLIRERLERRRVPDARGGSRDAAARRAAVRPTAPAIGPRARALEQPRDLLLSDPRLAASGGRGHEHVPPLERGERGHLKGGGGKGNGRGFPDAAQQIRQAAFLSHFGHGPEEALLLPSNHKRAVRVRHFMGAGARRTS